MANKVEKEPFVRGYDGVTSPVLLPEGSLAGGKNVRKVSASGGWKPRKGCSLHNTTELESGAAVKSLHYYKNPFSADEHFIAQCNSKLLKESASNKLPSTQDTSYGTTLGVTVGTTPGFSDIVGEYFFFADGSGRPIVWGGNTPRAKGFFVYDISETDFVDYTRVVTDGRLDTEGVVLGEATDQFYVYSEERITGVVLNLGTSVNTTDRTIVVKAWRGGAWTPVTTVVDGTRDTATLAKTLAQDGTISWVASASDLMRAQSGIMGYAYQFTWSGALSGSVTVISCDVVQAATNMTNKWNGEHEWVTGCRFYDHSVVEYKESLGQVSNESTSQYLDLSEAQTTDFLYLKTPEPAAGFGLGIVTGYENTATAKVDQVEYWNGSAWTAIASTAFTQDSTNQDSKSLAQTGIIGIDGSSITTYKRGLKGDDIPGYWYRLSWDVAWSTTVRVYACTYIPFPEVLPAYNGCVEFKGRLILWGDPEFPNRLRFSAKDHPTCFAGNDSGYTDRAFGDAKKILCAMRFYNELIIFKEDSVHLLEGEGPGTFGILRVTDKVGLASPKSAQVSEVGFPNMKTDEPMTIAIWQDVDGMYSFDGRKTKKISFPIENYFNPEYAACITAATIKSRQAFVDPINDEYHFLLPAGELVYNYSRDEWCPPWARSISIDTGLSFRANDGRFYSYGASSAGFIVRLETDTADKNVANADVAIDHSIKTRALSVKALPGIMIFTLRGLWAELKARTVGTIVTETFYNLYATGVVQAVPSAMSMVSTVAAIVVPKLDMSIENCKYIQVECSLDEIDQEMEIYSVLYEVGVRGLSE